MEENYSSLPIVATGNLCICAGRFEGYHLPSRFNPFVMIFDETL